LLGRVSSGIVKELQGAGRVAGFFLFLSGGVPADLRPRTFR
jgi:hypothetical protein